MAAILAIIVSLRWGGPRTVLAAIVAFTAVLTAYVVDPSASAYVHRIGTALRLINSTSGAASDASRARLANQAILDFRHNPITGIGYSFITGGHVVPLELLAAGGVFALAGFVVYYLAVFMDWQRIRATILHNTESYLYLRAGDHLGLHTGRRQQRGEPDRRPLPVLPSWADHLRRSVTDLAQSRSLDRCGAGLESLRRHHGRSGPPVARVVDVIPWA